MNKDETTINRKARHVEICVRDQVGSRVKRTGLDDLDFEHNALPELALSEIDTRCSILGHPLQVPLIISSMTGGYPGALEINRSLALAASKYGIAMGVGSERQALEHSAHHQTFSVVRASAPTSFLFANIGGAEVATLSRQGKIGDLRRIIDLIEANAIAIHLNPLQELLQPEGSHDFRGVLNGISECVKELGVPVIAKEVGAGISKSAAKQLLGAGVSVIDVAGAGGTSWAGVEILRNEATSKARVDPFWDWGISTVDAVLSVGELQSEYAFELVASGGISNGLDVAKAIALGADLTAMARPLIAALVNSGEEALNDLLESISFQLRASMYLTGSRTLADLHSQRLYKK